MEVRKGSMVALGQLISASTSDRNHEVKIDENQHEKSSSEHPRQ